MSAMCKHCGSGPWEGTTVFRLNPVGEKGVWICRGCMTPEQHKALDPETVRLVNIINPPLTEEPIDHDWGTS